MELWRRVKVSMLEMPATPRPSSDTCTTDIQHTKTDTVIAKFPWPHLSSSETCVRYTLLQLTLLSPYVFLQSHPLGSNNWMHQRHLTHFLPRTGIPHSYGSVPTAHERGIHVSIRTFGFGVAMRKSNGSWGSHRGRLLLIHYTFGVHLIEAKSAGFVEMQRRKFTVSEVINELTWAGESTPGNLLGRNSVKQVCFYSS